MKYNFFIIILLLFASCGEKQIQSQKTISAHQDESSREEFIPEDSVMTEVFQSEIGWGYDISVNGKKFVHQPHIPAVGGVKGFASAEAAAKTAELVKRKICRNILPPSVSKAELDSLGVLD